MSTTSRAALLILLLVAGLPLACGDGGDPHDLAEPLEYGEPIERDFEAIQERDTLVVLTTYNSTSYFLYRGEPMGYEYGLLRAFADEHDLALRVDVVSDRDSLYYLLNQGAGDVVAARMIPQPEDLSHIAFTDFLYRTSPAVVQREATPEDVFPEAADTLMAETVEGGILPESVATSPPDSIEVEARLIRRPSQLAGEEVVLPSHSAFTDRLIELSDRLTGDIEVVETSGTVTAESLIRAVSLRSIDLTVSQSNLARLKESYYTNLVVLPTLGPPDSIAWAIRKNAPGLQEALNTWLRSDGAENRKAVLYKKYFVDRQGYRERIADEYLTSETGKLSPYDSLLQTYADTLGWNWLLLASQTFQESRFDPRARSWAGAAGLLQLMPPTARQFGVSNVYDPEDNVRGAVRFITWLDDYWRDELPDGEEELLKFILASYNTGHGHVEDARRLTRKHGDDPNQWDDVAYWLLQKSKRQYYTDPVVKYGYCRGLEPVTYVSRILDRFAHYQQFVVPTPAEEATGTDTQASRLPAPAGDAGGYGAAARRPR